MSKRRRILSAFAIFAFATGALAIADAKKPAVLKQTVQAMPQKKEEPKRVKKYLPVESFGGY
jgi:hypothetical protein